MSQGEILSKEQIEEMQRRLKLGHLNVHESVDLIASHEQLRLRLSRLESLPVMERLAKAEAERDAMKCRAESAESDWQVADAERDELRDYEEYLKRLSSENKGAFNHVTSLLKNAIDERDAALAKLGEAEGRASKYEIIVSEAANRLGCGYADIIDRLVRIMHRAQSVKASELEVRSMALNLEKLADRLEVENGSPASPPTTEKMK